MDRVVTVGQQRTDRMAHPDDAMGGRRGRARQQPRPPAAEYLPPRLPSHLVPEEGGLVGDPLRVAQRFAPVRADRAAAAGKFLQPPHVAVHSHLPTSALWPCLAIASAVTSPSAPM